MWTLENRPKYNRDHLRYPSDLTDEEWAAGWRARRVTCEDSSAGHSGVARMATLQQGRAARRHQRQLANREDARNRRRCRRCGPGSEGLHVLDPAADFIELGHVHVKGQAKRRRVPTCCH
jgi:type IV secretory pathway VirD2 relaxase